MIRVTGLYPSYHYIVTGLGGSTALSARNEVALTVLFAMPGDRFLGGSQVVLTRRASVFNAWTPGWSPEAGRQRLRQRNHHEAD